MNSNVAMQHVGTVAWDGTAAYPGDIRKFTRFAWSFEVTAAIVADAVFNVQSAPPSDSDPCVPGTFIPVPEISVCEAPFAIPGPQAQITIPADTPVGSICSGTIPCRPNAFVRLASVSGTVASIRGVLIRQGPLF